MSIHAFQIHAVQIQNAVLLEIKALALAYQIIWADHLIVELNAFLIMNAQAIELVKMNFALIHVLALAVKTHIVV